MSFRLLQIAPAPSAAALAAAEVGDLTLLMGEEQAWISERLALGTNPRLPAPQRARSPTIPATPRALRSATGEHHVPSEAVSIAAPATVPPTIASGATATEDHRRSFSTDQVLDDESI